jgi:hypothetical protein
VDISGKPAEIHMVLEIKRKDTGIVETYNIIGKVTDIEHLEEADERNPHNSGS